MISIIIPTYQHAEALKKCLWGIAKQTFKDFEVIVVDDGSTDNTEQVVRRAAELPLKYIKQENRGAPAARNRGFEESKGEFVIFCDADTMMREDCLKKMYDALENPPLDSPPRKRGEREGDGRAMFAYSSFVFGSKKFRGFAFDSERLKKQNYIHSTSLVRREWVPKCDESLKKLQDWDFFLQIVKKGGRGVWIPEELFSVQITRPGMSQWAPRIAYTKIGRKLGLWKQAVEKYDKAYEIVKKKHRL